MARFWRRPRPARRGATPNADLNPGAQVMIDGQRFAVRSSSVERSDTGFGTQITITYEDWGSFIANRHLRG